jgi:D-proline reductase (dithiol) PrdB
MDYMNQTEKTVDGFRFLPPSLRAWIRSTIPSEEYDGDIPWTPLSKPLNEATFALVTSAGISLKSDPPFDMEREKAEPTWGDPSYRIIPKGTKSADINVNHLHINTEHILADINVMLPLARMEELSNEGVIGNLASTAYSFYGFQWERTDFLDTAIAPMIDKMKLEGVDVVLLTPA